MSSKLVIALVVAAGAAALSGCAVSSQHIADDYGRAVREGVVAQIADPDAHYSGDPIAASNGIRTDSAQVRYEKGTVIQPASTSTSTVSVGGGGGGGGGK